MLRVAGVVVPMCASTDGVTVAVALGEPTRTTPPPEAVPVASASPRPIALTVTVPVIGFGTSAFVRSPIVTESPIAAVVEGLLSAVASVPAMSIPPPEPTETVAAAGAPTVSALRLTPVAFGIDVLSPMSAVTEPRTCASPLISLTLTTPPPPLVVVAIADFEV